MEIAPRCGRAGHGDGHPAPVRHGGMTLSAQRIQVERAWGAPRAVETVQLPAIPDEGEGIRAYAIGGRLDHSEGDGSGEGSVYRVATPLQHGDASLHRERLACRDHAPPGDSGSAL